MAAAAVCPRCGNALGANGLCAPCLFSGALSTTASEPFGSFAAEPGGSREDSYGHYELLEVLGEGGMGTVYRARQQQPLKREVALKVVKPGLDGAQVLARFNYERQALARMEHPNVARVLDAGATPQGRPYFVMEFIPGQPITAYCDAHRLTIRERLKLFLPVCHALQHAHQKGIIHRDIKPSNVLVTQSDGSAVPKIIDFGIAKAIDPMAAPRTGFTQFGQLVGTPEYMSPEAADVINQDLDTASDVYSLGVLLYELLVGVVPFRFDESRGAHMLEVLRVIREDDAPVLPQRLGGLADGGAEVADRRNTTIAGLRRALHGDLTWVVAKALEKLKSRRYGSVAELAADIERHLRDEPVQAGPPDGWYRASKFLRRNRGWVAAAVTVTLVLVGGVVATAYQARVANRARAEAEQQRNAAQSALRRAEAESARAQQQEAAARTSLADVRTLANSMLFELDDRVKDLAGATPARETLVRLGVQYLGKSGALADDFMGAAHFRMGELQGPDALRDLDGARQSYQQSITMVRRRLSRNPEDMESRRLLALALLRLAALEDVDQARNAGYATAEAVAASVLRDSPRDIGALHIMAEIAGAQQQYKRAVEMEERALAAGAVRQDDKFRHARALMELGAYLLEQSPALALTNLQRALTLAREIVKEEPANAVYRSLQSRVLARLGELQVGEVKMELARSHVSEALAMARDVAAADRANASFQLLQSQMELQMGELERNAGKREEGSRQFTVALQLARAQAKRFPKILNLQLWVGNVLEAMATNEHSTGNSAAAIVLYREAEALSRAMAKQFPASKEPGRALARALYSHLMVQIVGGGLRPDDPSVFPLAEEGIAVSRRLTQTNGSAEDWFLLAHNKDWTAHALVRNDRWPEAARMVHEAVETYDLVLAKWGMTQQQRLGAFEHYGAKAHFLDGLGRHKEAIQAAERAVAFAKTIWQATPERFMPMAIYWSALWSSRFQHFRVGNLEKVAEIDLYSLSIVEPYINADSEQSWARAMGESLLNVAGNEVYVLGQRDAALRRINRLVDYLDALFPAGLTYNLERRIVANYYKFAMYFSLLVDEPDLALAVGRKALPIHEQFVQRDPKDASSRGILAEVLEQFSNAHRHKGNLGEAADWQAKRLASMEQAPGTPNGLLQKAQAQALLGFVLQRKGELEQSGRHMQTALQTAEQVLADLEGELKKGTKNGAAVRFTINAWDFLGTVHAAGGDSSRAREYWERSAALARARRDALPEVDELSGA